MAQKIAIIEDDQAISQMYRIKFQAEGYEVETAENGKIGLELCEKMNPDIVLLDLMMPEMDGWEVYNSLRSDPETRSIPVIVVTARARTQEQLNALRVAKVEDYIIKPFGPAQLLESIERVLQRQGDNLPAEK